MESYSGHEPYQDYTRTCDTLSLPIENESLLVDSLDKGWGYWSGHNSHEIIAYADKVEIDKPSMLSGMFVNVAKNKSLSFNPFVRFALWQDNNGKPGKIIHTVDMLLLELAQGVLNFVEFDSALHVSQSFFVGYQLPYNFLQDTFAVYQTSQKVLDNNFFVYKNEDWSDVNTFSAGEVSGNLDIRTVACDSLPKWQMTSIPETVGHSIAFLLYPNPARDLFYVKTIPMNKGPIVRLYDISGKSMPVKVVHEGQGVYKIVPSYPLSRGIYFVQVLHEKAVNTRKILFMP